MPHFTFDIGDDDIVRGVYKDGVLIETEARLEMPHMVVQTYFRSAILALHGMTADDNDREANRRHGVQCFLMALVGTEAFLNIFFHVVGRERKLPKVVDLATKDKAAIEHKVAHLPRLAYGTPLPAQKRLNKKMRELYDLRSLLVHPKWVPSSVAMPGMMIDGMVDNPQKLFEDRDFCREALRWCLLVIARIGIHAAGNNVPNERFVWQWTSLADTNAALSDALGIPATGP